MAAKGGVVFGLCCVIAALAVGNSIGKSGRPPPKVITHIIVHNKTHTVHSVKTVTNTVTITKDPPKSCIELAEKVAAVTANNITVSDLGDKLRVQMEDLVSVATEGGDPLVALVEKIQDTTDAIGTATLKTMEQQPLITDLLTKCKKEVK